MYFVSPVLFAKFIVVVQVLVLGFTATFGLEPTTAPLTGSCTVMSIAVHPVTVPVKVNRIKCGPAAGIGFDQVGIWIEHAMIILPRSYVNYAKNDLSLERGHAEHDQMS